MTGLSIKKAAPGIERSLWNCGMKILLPATEMCRPLPRTAADYQCSFDRDSLKTPTIIKANAGYTLFPMKTVLSSCQPGSFHPYR
jgi:hypothetical protein